MMSRRTGCLGSARWDRNARWMTKHIPSDFDEIPICFRWDDGPLLSSICISRRRLQWSPNIFCIVASKCWEVIQTRIYVIKNVVLITHFCCDFLIFIFFVCMSRSLVLFFFLIDAISVVVVFNMRSRRFRLGFFNSSFHFFDFLTSHFDLVVLEAEIAI